MRTLKLVAALSVAGAMSLASWPVQAAPIPPVAAKPYAQDDGSAIQVRWGHGWHGGGWHGGGFGWGLGALAAGALIGAAVASPYYYGGYPGYSYGYGYPYYGGYGYGYPYAYAPAYYPSYGYYRPIRRYHVWHRPYWGNSYGMYRVRHYRYW